MDSSYPFLFCFFLFMLIWTWRDSSRFPAVTHKMNVSCLTKVALSCYWLFRIIRFLIFWLPPFNFIYSASKSLSLSFLNSSSTLQLQFLSPWLLLFSVDLWLICFWWVRLGMHLTWDWVLTEQKALQPQRYFLNLWFVGLGLGFSSILFYLFWVVFGSVTIMQLEFDSFLSFSFVWWAPLACLWCVWQIV